MESTTTEHSFTYPLELIELILSNSASDSSDLASWGLVAKAFYFPSRKHLFAKIRIDLTSDNRQTYSHNARRLSGILEILSENVAIRELIHHFVVEYHFSEYPRGGRGGDCIFQLKSSDFRDILPQIPALRTLTITHPRGEYFSIYNEALMSALADLRHSCPYLHRLNLIGLGHVPIGFIRQWTNVVDLKLYQVGLIEGGPMLEQSTPVQPLERFSLRYDPWLGFPEPVTTIEIGKLQYLQISISIVSLTKQVASVLYLGFNTTHAWNLIKKSSTALNHLHLEYVFSRSSWPHSLSTIPFPSLEVLEIDDEIHPYQEGGFLPLARFLKPNKTDIFNIQTILISFAAFIPEQAVLNDDAGWLKLDSALTSEQYEYLSKVEIRLRFFHNEDADETKVQVISDLLKDCLSLLLPMVSSSPSINLQFSVLVRYSNFTFTWDNHASAVGVTEIVRVKR